MSDLWEKDTWSNTNILYMFNRVITEYDMEEAGFNLIKEYGLLPRNIIKKLSGLPKETRKVRIGIMEKTDKELVRKKKIAFASAREQFIKANKLDQNDIIDIRKDAIFTVKECKYQKFGVYIRFRPKNTYMSFLRIGKRSIELFYTPDGIDVKGISDDIVPLHENGMLIFFNRFFRMMAMESHENTLRFLRKTIDDYKKLNLPVDYYRTFNNKSVFITKEGTEMMDYWEEHKDELNIEYNYFILLNIAKILL